MVDAAPSSSSAPFPVSQAQISLGEDELHSRRAGREPRNYHPRRKARDSSRDELSSPVKQRPEGCARGARPVGGDSEIGTQSLGLSAGLKRAQDRTESRSVAFPTRNLGEGGVLEAGTRGKVTSGSTWPLAPRRSFTPPLYLCRVPCTSKKQSRALGASSHRPQAQREGEAGASQVPGESPLRNASQEYQCQYLNEP